MLLGLFERDQDRRAWIQVKLTFKKIISNQKKKYETVNEQNQKQNND